MDFLKNHPLAGLLLAGSLLLVVWSGCGAWGAPTWYIRDRAPWPNAPVFDLSGPTEGERISVLLALLAQDREEIRYYQDKLFTISLSFTGLIFATATFALKMKNPTPWSHYAFAFACISVCVFYLFFVDFAQAAIAVNDNDLTGIQYALGLGKKDVYLQGREIYPEGPSSGHRHIRPLVIFNTLLTLGVVSLLVFLPHARRQNAAPTV